MKLVFIKEKDADQNISVFHRTNDGDREFSYVEMINHLIRHGGMEEPELEGDFTEAESTSVKSMVDHINSELDSLKMQWNNEEEI